MITENSISFPGKLLEFTLDEAENRMKVFRPTAKRACQNKKIRIFYPDLHSVIEPGACNLITVGFTSPSRCFLFLVFRENFHQKINLRISFKARMSGNPVRNQRS